MLALVAILFGIGALCYGTSLRMHQTRNEALDRAIIDLDTQIRSLKYHPRVSSSLASFEQPKRVPTVSFASTPRVRTPIGPYGTPLDNHPYYLGGGAMKTSMPSKGYYKKAPATNEPEDQLQLLERLQQAFRESTWHISADFSFMGSVL